MAPALARSPASAIESHFTEIANDRWTEVRGEGSVSAPDFAELRLGVTTTARTAHEAMTANANAANALVPLIKSEGVAPADLQTLRISISPLFLAAITRPPTITGYTVPDDSIVRDIPRLGALLDKTIAAGANTIDA